MAVTHLMAFGEHRGNQWLLLPGLGVAILVSLYFDIIPNDSPHARYALVAGVFFLIAGTVLAGLIGHIIWLVPLALIICSPLIVVFSISERIETWRHNRRNRDVETEPEGSSASPGT
ncbi:MAG: hypothetical protein Aurels2KO_13330 [Aureliella sp.]